MIVIVRKQKMIRLKVKEIAEAKKINMAKLSRLADVNYNTIRAIYSDSHPDEDIMDE